MQAERLLHHYHCWGLDLEGQGDSAEGTPSGVNIIHSFVDCILAVVDHLQCLGALPCCEGSSESLKLQPFGSGRPVCGHLCRHMLIRLAEFPIGPLNTSTMSACQFHCHHA